MVTLGYELFTSLSGQWSLCTQSSAISGLYMFYGVIHPHGSLNQQWDVAISQ